MRKTMIMILLASAAALPAIAQADPGDGRGSPRGGWQRPLDRGGDGRGQQSQQNRAEVRNDRAEVRQDRREISRDRQEVQQDRSQMRQDWRAGNPATARQDWRETQRDRLDAGADRRDLRQDQRETWRDRRAIANGVANSPAEQRRDWRADRRDDGRDWRDTQRNWQDNRRDGRDRRRDWRNDNDRRDNDHRWVDNRDWGRRDNDWNRDWRRDRRYDWQGWRYQNRSRFHLRQYYAPRGYSYNRWYVGYRLDPWFYASDYWISDPFYYRLPAAYGPYRWVRYFDDVMLIDIRDGRIVDIIYDFFW